MSEMNFGYSVLRNFIRFWIDRFFRKVQITGTENLVPGPAILAVNHPNNLIDSLLVSYAINRKIHYLATAQMFRNRIVGLFLRGAGVIPVYRKQDAPAHGEKNVAMFQACYDILGRGGAIGIYPEGTTHVEPRVRQIKTGAARIALEAEHQYHSGVKLVPIGLNYSVRKSFRGEVVICIGPAMDLSELVSLYERDPVAAVDDLTAELQKALEAQIINIELPELDRLVQEIEEIYRGELIRDLIEFGLPRVKIDPFRLSKKLVEGIHFFNQRDPERLRILQNEIQDYREKLKRAHLDDTMLREVREDAVSYKRFLIRSLLFVLGSPIALWGTINHVLPHQISRAISRKIAQKETDYATVRILCGIVLYPVFYGFQIYWVLKRFGWVAASAYGCSLPMFGTYAYYFWEKYARLRSDLHLLWIILTRRRLVQHLAARRERLIAEMDRAKEEYLSAVSQT